MMKKTMNLPAIVLVLIFNLPLLSFSQVNFTPLSWTEVQTIIDEKQDKPVLLYFFFSGCGVCKKIEVETFQDSTIASFVLKNYKAYKINGIVNGKSLVNDFYNIHIYPTLIILDTNNQIVHKVSGYIEKYELLQLLKIDHNSLTKSYTWYKNMFESGITNKDFLRDYCSIAINTFELDSVLFNRYIESLDSTDLITYDVLRFIYMYSIFNNKCLIRYNSKAYNSIFEQSELYFKYFDSIQVISRQAFILNNCLLSLAKINDSINFFNSLPKISTYSNREYEIYNEENENPIIIFELPDFYSKSLEIFFFDHNRNSTKYTKSIEEYNKLIINNEKLLRNNAWYYSSYFSDSTKLMQAEDWIKQAIFLNESSHNYYISAYIKFKLLDMVSAHSDVLYAIQLAKENNEDYAEITELLEKIEFEMKRNDK